MLKKNRLFTPGPTPLLPQAQMAMAAYGAHHRTAEFRALFTRVLVDVKEFIGTNNDVLVLTSSGTGFMESSVSNLTSPGDRVLVLTAGKFGERWTALAKAFGCAVETVTAPYGETFSLDDVRRKLTPETRCVYMQATESSTGARHDVEAIAKLVRALPDTLLVVDAITGLGTTRFDVDGWGIDIILGGSQKALMIPPGLAYGAISERAWQRMETTKSPRFYFDLRKERKSAAKAETVSTPSTALFAGLAAALDYVRQMGDGNLAAGRDALIANAELCAAMTRAGVQALGLKKGDRVAIVSDLDYSWARLAGVRVTMQVDFGQKGPAQWEKAKKILSANGVVMVMSPHVPGVVDQPGWQQLGETGVYVYELVTLERHLERHSDGSVPSRNARLIPAMAGK